MNLMPEILEKLGIEVGEHFDIEYDTGIKFRSYYFDEDYQLQNASLKNSSCDFANKTDEELLDILYGKAIIRKKPWKPKNEEIYYYVKVDGEIGHYYCRKDAIDTTFLYMGNCFRTKEEAEAHKEEVLQKMQEAWGDSE